VGLFGGRYRVLSACSQACHYMANLQSSRMLRVGSAYPSPLPFARVMEKPGVESLADLVRAAERLGLGKPVISDQWLLITGAAKTAAIRA
jgi:hypothetical protein